MQAFVAYQALQAYLLALMQRLLKPVPRVVSKSHRPTSRGRPHFLLSYRFVVVLVEVTVAVVAVETALRFPLLVAVAVRSFG